MKKLTTVQVVVILVATLVGLNIGRYFYSLSQTEGQQYGNAIEGSANDK